MRHLIYVRIVHSPADMGSLSEKLRADAIGKIGKDRWDEHLVKIKQFWEELEMEIFALDLALEKTKIFQDGLPCDGELGLKIVHETAKQGSQNYRIVEKLIEQNAGIVATESPALLIEERELVIAMLGASSPEELNKAEAAYKKRKDWLLEERDSYIASRINSTLRDGESGILFIGAEHNVLPKLDGDIDVHDLVKESPKKMEVE